ncbi:hypothetical protein [Poseidonocella sedimentorum]|uniref:DUF2946 domain-containing protein n=1 Tax=Poseidonocella sedimentorum TaxID=871652 RepID=A0A1I6D5W1_9RHOB|nr:hypothetical protein [Poseidonocella sedimentorum]SFR00838.1 hypothetical protein SAMN04515673_102233 [Poseidonocella sedimentorum]
MMSPLALLRSGWISLVLIVGLCVVGSLHHPDPRPDDPALARYIAMGGKIADICGDPSTDSSLAGCEFCRLTAAALLPGKPALWMPARLERQARLLGRATRIHRRKRREPNLRSRAPPRL